MDTFVKATLISFILIVILAISNKSVAQTEKGSTLVGGAASIGGYFQKRQNSLFELVLAGNYAPFVRNNIAIGGVLGYGYRTQVIEHTYSEQREQIHVLTMGPFFRFYFGKGKLVKPFFGFWGVAGIAFRNGSEKFHYYTTMVQGGPGVAIFLNQNIAIELALNYQGDWTENGYEYIHHFGLQLGFQAHLSRKSTN